MARGKVAPLSEALNVALSEAGALGAKARAHQRPAPGALLRLRHHVRFVHDPGGGGATHETGSRK